MLGQPVAIHSSATAAGNSGNKSVYPLSNVKPWTSTSADASEDSDDDDDRTLAIPLSTAVTTIITTTTAAAAVAASDKDETVLDISVIKNVSPQLYAELGTSTSADASVRLINLNPGLTTPDNLRS